MRCGCTIKMACEDSGFSTYELWSRSSFLPIKEILFAWHNWGATTYVLKHKLQKGGSHIPKWENCSRCWFFLGFIRLHSTIVVLILDLHNQSISPQFHIVFDDMFATVASVHNETLRNHRHTLVVPSNVSTSVKEIWIGNVLLLESLLVKFLPAPEPFWSKDYLGWVWRFFIYLFVVSFDDPEQGGGVSFSKLDAIERRNFIMRSCCSCWMSGKGF